MEQIIKNVIKLLKKRDFYSASDEVFKYEASQPFKRGMGIDWKEDYKNKNYKDTISILKLIFSSHPSVLENKFNENQYEKIRIGTSIDYLFGTSNPSQYFNKDDLLEFNNLDFKKACRLLFFNAKHIFDVNSYIESGVIKSVEILTNSKSCDECKKLSCKEYLLNEVPELPYIKCTCEDGCKCCTSPVIEF